MNTRDESLRSTGQTFAATTMYARFRQSRRLTGPAMLFAVGSRARTSAMPGSVPGLPASKADCGPSLPGSFAWYDLDSCSWRTWQRCLDGGLEEFSATWPRSGTMRNGIASRRRPLVPSTFGKGCGWWPTPGANDWKGGAGIGQRRGQLDEAVENLPAWVLCPCCEDYLCLIHGKHAFECGCPSVEEQLTDPYAERACGRLSPEFVEWLMGFPVGFTDCEDLGTPSSPK